MTELQTHLQNIAERRVAEVGANPDQVLFEGEVMLEIERFAFTANNVTYGAVGERIGYWQFFPPTAVDGQTDGWGIIPVWGYATVAGSAHPEIAVGERVYGYLPMAKHWVMRPGRISAQRWVDSSEHRAKLPVVYNSYQRLVDVPPNPKMDSLTSLLMPLYGTAFCLCDALESEQYHGAEHVVIVSASSKTSLGLAYGLRQLPEGERPRVIGLTSSGNREFVDSVGFYDQVVTYDAIDALDTDRPTVIVDMAGNRELLSNLHTALGDNMRWCHNVGLTHLDTAVKTAPAEAAKLINERSAMFFAPSHMEQRSKALGSEEWNRRMGAFTAGAIASADDWLSVRDIHGLSQFLSDYDAMVAGQVNAREGLMVIP